MVQVNTDTMKALKTAVKEMKDYKVRTGSPTDAEESYVGVEWFSSDAAERPK